jgi:chromate transporter
MAAVTAAVVGVVLNLAVWFGWHVVRPGGASGTTDWFAVAVGAAAFAALQWGKVGVVTVVLVSGGMGLVWGGVG